jgi:hypothetical protein
LRFFACNILDNSFIFSYLKTLQFYKIENFINFIKDKFKIEHEYQNISINDLKNISYSKFIKIGSHTLNHPILLNETAENSYNEIKESKLNLEQLINKEINTFAYPNGLNNFDFGLREIDFIKKFYKTAVSMDLISKVDQNYNFRLPRVPIFTKPLKNLFINKAFKFYYFINKLRMNNKILILKRVNG